MNTEVFVSYSNQDYERVMPLVERLRNIDPGQNAEALLRKGRLHALGRFVDRKVQSGRDIVGHRNLMRL